MSLVVTTTYKDKEETGVKMQTVTFTRLFQSFQCLNVYLVVCLSVSEGRQKLKYQVIF